MAARHPETELVPFLRGDLLPREHERVARHLAGCRDCRETAETMREVFDDLTRSIPAPPQVHWARYRAELRAKLDAREVRRAHAPRWWRPVPLGVSAVLAGVLLLLAVPSLFRPGTPPADLASVEEAVIGGRLPIVQNYALLERLDLLEDLDVIGQLDRLSAVREG